MEFTSCIQIKDMRKKFKGFELNVPELQVPQGFATALIGENGAGKSTLLKILSGVRKDFQGEVIYFDGSMSEPEVRENTGYIGQGLYFMPHWSLNQIGEVSELLFDGFHKDKYHSLCKELAVKTDNKDKKFGKMSDGMKMKTMLASVFARDTKMLLLDEPASPLDPLMRDKLCSMIRDYMDQDETHSVFFSTHNIADMEAVTDYAIIMEQGKVVEQGFVEDLKDKYILVKGEREDLDQVKDKLISCQANSFGFEGLCLASEEAILDGLDVAKERPTLSQISVAVMKQYSKIG